ncbi:endochitinase [Mycena vulgaris]|nr:endochitinase [Mycena vulgaris]
MYRSLSLLFCARLALSTTQHVHRSPSGTSPVDVNPRGANVTDDSDAAEVIAAAWYPGWSIILPEEISWDKYTHMAFAFATTTPDPANITVDGATLADFVARAKDKNVSPLLSIGGWTGSQHFSTAVATKDSRKQFVDAIVSLVTQYELDGIDFDWEYPGVQGIGCNTVSLDDTANFLLFLQQLRQENSTLVLTAAVGMAPFVGSDGEPLADVSAFVEVLDRIEIMVYDTWYSKTTAGPNAALDDACAPSQYRPGSVKSAVEAWTAANFPVDQIVLGLAAYGHSFNITPADAISGGSLDLYPAIGGVQPAGSSDATGDNTPDACGTPYALSGVFTFAGLIEKGFLDSNGSALHNYMFDQCTKTPYVYNEDTHVMVSYDDARSFAAKGEFIVGKGLAGFAMWDVTGDSRDILVDSLHSAMGIVDC